MCILSFVVVEFNTKQKDTPSKVLWSIQLSGLHYICHGNGDIICFIQSGGKNIRITVMNNLLPSTIEYHEKYDLKVSTGNPTGSSWMI